MQDTPSYALPLSRAKLSASRSSGALPRARSAGPVRVPASPSFGGAPSPSPLGAAFRGPYDGRLRGSESAASLGASRGRPRPASGGVFRPSGSAASLYTGGPDRGAAYVRAGGRMFTSHPLAGASAAEMAAAARQREAHNRQRTKLKQLLRVATDGSGQVSMEDLLLSAKIAKMPLPEELLFKTDYSKRYTTARDGDGHPTRVKWEMLYNSLDYPQLQRANTSKSIKKQISIASFGGDAAAEAAAEAEEAAAAAEAERLAAELEMDKQVRMAQRVLKEHMTTRFTHLTRAFRTIDEDKSGKLSRRELKAILITFNLGVGDKVLDRLIDLADYDGDGHVNYAEFARLMTAEDVLGMKDTLRAAGGKWGHEDKAKKKPTRAPKKVELRPGVTAMQLRSAQRMLKERILTKFATLTEAFRSADEDKSGQLGRDEIKLMLRNFNTTVSDRVLDNLLDYADFDGDGSIEYAEFARVLTADDVLNMKNTLQAAPTSRH